MRFYESSLSGSCIGNSYLSSVTSVLSLAWHVMSMSEVESLQDALRKCESCEYDHDVENLVASTQDVESPLTPPLGNLPCVNASLQHRVRSA